MYKSETLEEEVLTSQDSFYSFEDIPNKYVQDAKGVNIDYLLTLVKSKNTVYVDKYPINKHFDDVFQKISEFISKENFTNNDIITLYDIVANSELLDLSKKIIHEYKIDYFKYCPKLSSRYLPNLTLDINVELTNFLEKKKIIDDLYTSNSYHKNVYGLTEDEIAEKAFSIYLEALKAVSENLGKYILLWIHAYRITLAIRKCRENKEVIAHSHKYKGWSLPDYQLTSDLNLKFRTNFGYGYSSHFYTVLVFKNVKIFPFMDWCNYKYAKTSEMINYTELFHELTKDSKTQKVKSIHIEDSDWEKAMLSVAEACNISMRSEKEFISKYIVNPIEKIILFLEEILEKPDAEINKEYRNYNHDFDIKEFDKQWNLRAKSVKLMNVKAARVCGALDFILEFKSLSHIVDNTEYYIKKIEDINLKMLPILKHSLIESLQLSDEMQKNIDDLYAEISRLYKGSNTEIGIEQMMKDKKILNDVEFESKYPEFDEIQEMYLELIRKKNNIEMDYKNIMILINKIKFYVNKMDGYFN
ncbi:hypothetical protein [Acinetobacter guillouiae]|uniref:hypothetical protein n=1 Tax=Acinetobacter guillouiae TaxID=106649 RepID=UPI00333F2FB5